MSPKENVVRYVAKDGSDFLSSPDGSIICLADTNGVFIIPTSVEEWYLPLVKSGFLLPAPEPKKDKQEER